MKNIAIIEQSHENEDGDVIKRFVFTMDARDTTAPTSRKVTFEPIAVYNRMLRMKQTDGAWGLTGETIYFQMRDIWTKAGRNPIPDSLGGDALGRPFGKEADKFSSDELEALKAGAKWYTYLFGRFTFEGQAPVLGNLRLTGGQGVDYGKLKLEDKDFKTTKIQLSAAAATSGMRKFNLKFEASEVPANKDFDKLSDEVTEVVEEANSAVLTAYEEASKNKATGEKLKKGGVKVQTVEEASDLDDEIPF